MGEPDSEFNGVEQTSDLLALAARLQLESGDTLLRLLLEQVAAAVWTTDRYRRLASARGAILDRLEISECLTLPGVERALAGESASHELERGGRSYQLRIEPLRDPAGRIVGAAGVAVDITDRRRAEESLRASEQEYRELVENAGEIIYTHDLLGKVTSLNRAAERITGYSREEAVGRNILDIIPPEDRHTALGMMRQILRGAASTTYELPVIAKDGRRLLLEVSTRLQYRNGMTAGVQGIARDVTERRRLEEQVRQAQKMEAVEELAGGIAHDFNNLLSAILGYADLLKLEAKPDDRVFIAADVIQRAADRASALTQQLLGFARRRERQNVPVDLHDSLHELITLLGRTIDKSIRIVPEFCAVSPRVLGDPGQMHQVFLNLALNARDAMPEGGVLTFRTELAGPAAGAPDARAEVTVSVADTGVGIPREIRDRIFEPFFTTKGRERGTGMGLAMVYGIVKNHGGSVELESEPGCGSTFRIRLPLAAGFDRPRANVEPAAPARGSGRILVVEDEEVVRNALAKMLESLGYSVVCARDGEEAIELYQTSRDRVDLVILDMIMPGMSGRECLRTLRQIDPELKAILTSGYDREGIAPDALAAAPLGFLQKPYQLCRLARAVSEALRPGSSAGLPVQPHSSQP